MDKSITVPLPFQKETYWCWAAIAKGVVDLYTQGNNTFTQCSIATSVINDGDCCNGADCNVVEELENALGQVGHFSGVIQYYTPEGPFDTAKQTIRTEIDGGRPLGAKITWWDTTGHFVVICGYNFSDPDNCKLYVTDPECNAPPCPGQPAVSIVAVDGFFSNYQGQGSCTALYLTV